MKQKLLLSIVCVSLVVYATAQKGKGSLLYDLVNQSGRNGTVLSKKKLFTETDTITSLNKQAGSVLSAFAGLKLNIQTVLEIAASKPKGLQLDIPFNKYKNFTLNLVQQQLNSDGDFSFGTLQGNHVKTKASSGSGIHYRGYIDGDSTSLACISFFKDGSLMALFANSKGNFIIGKMGDGESNYIIYNDRNLLVPQNIQCGTDASAIVGSPRAGIGGPSGKPSGLPPATLCSKVRLYWEGDYELYSYNFQSKLSSTQNYMEGLFNDVAAMYQNEGIVVESSEMYVWTSKDPYGNNTSTLGLADFKKYWNNQDNAFDGDLAHLVAGGSTNNGGLAYILGNFCTDKTYAFAYSNVWGYYNTVPMWSWDVEVVTHETGHNFGSNHTQWCGWKTGPGGTCGAIDNCYKAETGGGCSTCPATTDTASLPVGWQGTVMSYCHLSGIGINLANGFGPLPQAVIRDAVSSGSGCLHSLIAATAKAQPICNTNDGAVSVTYDNDNLGKGPYTYLWTPGNYTTKNISGLSIPGEYALLITDDAGCSTSLSANVKALSKAGELVPLNIALPVCCAETADSITLKTKSPNIPNDCETIAWVRSATPLSTYNDVANAYKNAAASDLFFSTNSNTADSAVLKIKPPVSCAADSIWYYAAYISKKKTDKIKVDGNSVYQGNVVGGSPDVTIGSYVLIPDQTADVSTCQQHLSPSMKLSLNVTQYTGRANHLSLDIYLNGTYIRSFYGLAGIGKYNISTNALTGMPLGDLQILAYDYNCSGNACTGSTVSFTAVRTVTYPALIKPTFEASCSVAASEKVWFSPNAATCKTLAVNFKNFNLSEANCSVNINWQAENELSNNYFTIERSTDAHGFSVIASLHSKGNGTNSYNFTDNSPANGTNYYRIVQYDNDGKTTNTGARMITVNCLNTNNIKLYPNPAHTMVFLRSNMPLDNIEVINSTGQTLIKINSPQNQGGLSKFDTKKLIPGAYVCKITLQDGTEQNIKFVKN